MVDVYLVKFFEIVTRRLIIRLGFLLDFILFSVFFLFFIDVKSKYKKKTRKINPVMTSSGVDAWFPKFGSCSELSKAANADCFDDITGFLVFPRISRFRPLKAQ